MYQFVDELSTAVTAEVYESFRTAIALRRWPNGKALSEEQMETCMQAVMAYEYLNLPKESRTGYIPPKETPCSSPREATQSDTHDELQPLQFPDE